jgi:hypothetical protein
MNSCNLGRDHAGSAQTIKERRSVHERAGIVGDAVLEGAESMERLVRRQEGRSSHAARDDDASTETMAAKLRPKSQHALLVERQASLRD